MKALNAKAEFLIDGVRYHWSGWFGCQLVSREWRTLPAGTTRDLLLQFGEPPVAMTIYSTRREGLRVHTAWAVSKLGTHDEHVARIVDLQQQLRKLV